MGAVIQDFGLGGCRPPDPWNTLQDSLSGNHIVWIRYLGDDPYDQAYPCQIPPQGSLLILRNSSELMHVKVVGLTIFEGSYDNSGPI